MTGVSTSQVHEEEYPLSYLLPDGKIFMMAASTGKGYIFDVAPPGGRRRRRVMNGSAVDVPPGQDPLHRRRRQIVSSDGGRQPRARRST